MSQRTEIRNEAPAARGETQRGLWVADGSPQRKSGGENRKSELEEGKDRHRDMLWVMFK